MKHIKQLMLLSALGFGATYAVANPVKVDVNLDIKHEVGGVSDFNRKKHITVHSSLNEPDWYEEDATMDYLLNDLDVYFGRDNGMASWISKATAQDPNIPGKPDLNSLAGFGQWHKDNLYDNLPARVRAFEARSSEMIMGINPHGPYPTQSYFPKDLMGRDDAAGKYILRKIEYGAEWVGEYFDTFFRKHGEDSGVLLPKYWEVINEPDMDINVGRTFVMSSFEQVFEYHNLVAEEIRQKLPADQAPLIGGMTWGLHDLEKPDLSERYPDQQRAVRSRYSFDEGSLEDFLQSITNSTHWDARKDAFYQWDYLWKGFMDAAGDNMDFYAIHLYDWSPLGDNPRQRGTFRRGMTTEAILDMVESYDALVNGSDNIKPWVISEYGAIAQKHANLAFLQNDYRYSDWLHIRTFNQMFMQILTRPSQVMKSMPFAPIKAEWGLNTGPNGEAIRYEAALMHTDEPLSANYPEADWYVTDKIQWYELWSDVKGTRVDTHSSDPDVQVDAYVDGNHTYLILNNLEWYDIPIDLSFMGIAGNTVNSVNIKHSYLAEGLSPTNLGRPLLAKASLNRLPESVTLEPGSTIILDIEFNDDLAINDISKEKKYYSESLSGAGKGQAAKGQIHRVLGTALVANVNDVTVPSMGEATLRIAGQLYPFHAANPRNNTFTINGHTLDVRTQINPNAGGSLTEHYDYMGPEVDEGSIAMNLIEIPVPLEFLKENNEITAQVALARAFTAVSISVWDMSKSANRTSESHCSPCDVINTVSLSGDSEVKVKKTIALDASILPVSANNKMLNWSSSDVNIAAVDQNGLVTGISAGAVTITASTIDGSVSDSLQVSVSTIAPTSVTLNVNTINLAVNETNSLSVTIEPFTATNKNITWSSSDSNVASVSANGVVKGLSSGNAVITASAVDGGLSDSATVNVTSILLTSIDLPSTAVIISPGVYQTEVRFSPSNATDTSVVWSSDNSSIANVDQNGLITGNLLGATTIRAVSNSGGFEDSMIMNVIAESSISAAPIDVQSESIINTGGPYGGFDVSDKGINNNQSGDWAEFNIDFVEEGVYRFLIDAGTPSLTGTAIEVFINGVSAGIADIPSTGDWEVMQTTVVTNNLLVPSAGVHTIRIQSVGAPAAWQWNSDKITFVLLSALDPDLSEDGEPTDPTDPTEPVAASLVLDDAAKYKSTIYTVGDAIDVSVNFEAGTGNTVSDKFNGVKFFLRELDASFGVVKDILAFDSDAIGKQTGLASASLSLIDITPTANLPNGNFYYLFAAFTSSNESVVAITGVFPINIEGAGTEPTTASLTLDNPNKYRTTTYKTDENLEVFANFDAGEGHTVTDENGGVQFLLRELDASYVVQKDIMVSDNSVVGLGIGTASAVIPLAGLTPSTGLSNGHFYFLFARFTSSDGNVYQITGVQPITIIEPGIVVVPGAIGIQVDEVSKYIDVVHPVGSIMDVTINFETGSGNTVVPSAFAGVNGGIQFIVQELRANGSQVRRVVVGDSSSIGLQSGQVTASIPLAHPTQGNFIPSDELRDGHYYNLTARLKSSDGSTQVLENVFPITIGDDVAPEPDFDGDKIPDSLDPDDDNDGVDDIIDDFPFDKTYGVLGDFDGDNDIDRRDISYFARAIRDPSKVRVEFDFNEDGVVNSKDISRLRRLCSRNRCAE